MVRYWQGRLQISQILEELIQSSRMTGYHDFRVSGCAASGGLGLARHLCGSVHIRQQLRMERGLAHQSLCRGHGFESLLGGWS